jgi:hypothetical protein
MHAKQHRHGLATELDVMAAMRHLRTRNPPTRVPLPSQVDSLLAQVVIHLRKMRPTIARSVGDSVRVERLADERPDFASGLAAKAKQEML